MDTSKSSHSNPLSLSIGENLIKRTVVFKYLGYHVDERLSFNEHCKRMLQKVQKNSGILKYITRSRTSSARARKLISQAFIQPYLQMIYAVWPMLSVSSIETIEAKNRQLSRLIHNWWDATNDEVRWLLNYETAESKAQRFLRRFIDKSETIAPELFEDYILGKAMPMYLRMHGVAGKHRKGNDRRGKQRRNFQKGAWRKGKCRRGRSSKRKVL